MITLEQLQNEVGEWSRRNFPNNKPHHPLLGLLEESLYELSVDPEDAEDAIADAVIYLADYCARNNLKLKEARSNHLISFTPYPLIVGRLCHYHLKGEQGIRYESSEINSLKQSSVEAILSLLKVAAKVRNIDFDEAVEKTWNSVKNRDWTKNKKNGVTN